VKTVAKPPVPIDPADVIAAANDPKQAIANLPTMNLMALACSDTDREIEELVEKEFNYRLHQATTAELLSPDWLTNTNPWTLRQIGAEYTKRADATPDGVVRLYVHPNSSDDGRREFLKFIFAKRKDGYERKLCTWVSPVANLFTGSQVAEMFEFETDQTNRCWLAEYYCDFPGSRIDFLIRIHSENNWSSQPDSVNHVVTRIRQLLPTLSDSELRNYVDEILQKAGPFGPLIQECTRRSTIRPTHYQEWARRLQDRRNARTRLDSLSLALENCHSRLPFAKLLTSLQPSGKRHEGVKYLNQEALLKVLKNRLGEADANQLLVIFSKKPELREEVTLLYASSSATQTEKRDQFLAWGMDHIDRKQQDLSAFMAINFGANAAQIEAIYAQTNSSYWAPEEQLFRAYAALPDSDKTVLPSWAKGRLIVDDVQDILASRKDISGQDIIDLIEKNGDRHYNRTVFGIYCRKDGIDPKLLIDRFISGDLSVPEILLKALAKTSPEPVDVCRLIQCEDKFWGQYRLARDYAIEYFSTRPSDIETLLEQYQEGRVYEVLAEAYKLTDAYKKEVERLASTQ